MSERHPYGSDSTGGTSKKNARSPYLNDNFYNPNLYNDGQVWDMPSYTNDPYSNVYADQSSTMGYYPVADPYSPYSTGSPFQPPLPNQPTASMNQPPAAAASQFQSPMPAFDPNVINNQFVAAGAQMFQNSVNAYSQDLMNKGRSWFDNSLKYYFAVDTGYVLKKLLLLFFPFAQKDWLPKYTSNEQVAPRDDLNVPDLYIPCMAFVTYILAAGSIFGLKNAFSPEKLGMQASYALFWLILEVAMCLMVLYLMNIRNTLGFFHLVSYCSYKFVFMIVMVSSYVLIESSYYWLLIYSSISLGYFLIRSLNTTIQTNPNAIAAHGTTKVGLYLILGLAAVQPFIMYWLTSRVVFHPTANRIS